jgi:hypothetical protein
MSLDVSLTSETRKVKCVCSECGNEHEREDCDCYYDANITHNLNAMADHAGIYYHLWRPSEIGINRAKELIEPLEKGLIALKELPGFFKKYNPPNGWGTYEILVEFVEAYLKACKEYPEAVVRVSR